MKITTAKQLGSYLKDARNRARQSQSEVAKRVGIRQDTVSSFETNPDTTKLMTLFKLLSALDLELEVRSRSDFRSDTNHVAQSGDWQEEW
jgi:HTH-type transcriptional regulator/antitoxin HipB